MFHDKSARRSRVESLSLFLFLLTISPTSSRAETEGPCQGLCFTDATQSAGFFSLELYGGHGIQVSDVNGDGWLDVYVTHIARPEENRPDLLFVNQQTDPPTFREMGVEAGVSDDGYFEEISEESHAAVFADLDNDGDFDLFNIHTWNGHNRLYRNEGDGRFVDITESAGIDVTDIGSRGVVAADMDGDGFLDIVISAWQDAQPMVYWNLGGLHFERRRLKGVDNRPFANQGITAADYDDDRLPDLALTAYEFIENEGLGPVALLKNDTDRFVDSTGFSSVSYEKLLRNTGGTNGWSFADIDNDGHLDALIAGAHGAKLYRNTGEGRFELVQRLEGIYYTGAFGDVDNDGDTDLYLAGDSGLYLNNGGGELSFKDDIGLTDIGSDARSAVFADMNNDGSLDLLIASKTGRNSFFLNQSPSGAWLKVTLTGPRGDAGAFGAKVFLYEAGHGGDPQYLRGFREARGGTGYCSQDPPVLHFGVDGQTLYDIVVLFQDGSRLSRNEVASGTTVHMSGRTP